MASRNFGKAIEMRDKPHVKTSKRTSSKKNDFLLDVSKMKAGSRRPVRFGGYLKRMMAWREESSQSTILVR